LEARLMLYALAVALLMAASLAAMANQSGKLVGVHEIPPFVCDRVAVVPGLTVDPSRGSVGLNGSYRVTPDAVSVPGSRNPICARDAGG
jgi:hypothetical protein